MDTKAKKERIELTTRYHVYDPVLKKVVIKTKIINSGKEAPSLVGKGVILALLILIQLAALIASYVWLVGAFNWIILVAAGISVLTCLRVLSSNKNADSKTAWIIFLLILPGIGFIVYLFWGEFSASPLKRRKIKAINKSTNIFKNIKYKKPGLCRVRQESDYIYNSTGYIPHYGGGAEYFPTGEALFGDIIKNIETAEKYVFIEYFIIEDGELLEAFLKILEKKAAAGVDVRIIYDGLGSHGNLSRKTIKRIRKAGIKIHAFEKVYPIVNFFMNYRDHRKIVVIDGKTAYTGGANLADEYINKKKRLGYWKDTGIRIEGGATTNFTLMFLRLWEFVSGKKPNYSEYLINAQADYSDNENEVKGETGSDNSVIETIRNENETYAAKETDTGINRAAETIDAPETERDMILPYCDSPDNNTAAAKGVYNNIISNAKNYVYIMTPYFIVDNTVTDLLKNKAMSGVDVRIVLPGIPDKRTAYALSRSNAEKLIESGVRVFTYTPGFLHGKVMLSDGECAVIGSVNMDFRSYYQQHECAVYTTAETVINGVSEDFEKCFGECKEITAKSGKNVITSLIIAFLRLFAPLM